MKRDLRVITAAARELERGSLQLLQTDKSGIFGILLEAVFRKKSEEALNTVSVEGKRDVRKIRREIVTILKDDEIGSLGKQVMNQTKVFVKSKSFLEKPDIPLCTVINDLGTWQCSGSKVSSLNVV